MIEFTEEERKTLQRLRKKYNKWYYENNKRKCIERTMRNRDKDKNRKYMKEYMRTYRKSKKST